MNKSLEYLKECKNFSVIFDEVISYQMNCSRMLSLTKVSPTVRHGVRSVFTVKQMDTSALVLGVVKGKDKNTFSLTHQSEKVNNLSGGKLVDRLTEFGQVVGPGEAKYVGPIHPDLTPHVIVVGLDPEDGDVEENIDSKSESVRVAAGAGAKIAADLKVKVVEMDCLGDSQAAAEGASLNNWAYQQFKKKKTDFPDLKLFSSDSDQDGWNKGIILGSSQNLARYLMESPANFMTPTQFCKEAEKELAGLPVELVVRDAEWAEQMKMGSFLSVARGSHEPAKFLEMHYDNGDTDSPPVVLVGKGVTFDTGGISIKPSAKMDAMRGDMGGAATVTATMKAVASLGLKINLKVLVPLTENMPGGSATKPGDVVTAMNGVTIQVNMFI